MSATSALEALLQDFSRERSSPRAVCRRASRVVRKQSVILHSRSRARRDRCGISLAPDALAEPSPRKSDERAHAFTAFDSPSMEKSFHEDVAGSFGSSRDLRRGARVGTLCRWSSRESTRRIPGDSFGSCAISLRSRREEGYRGQTTEFGRTRTRHADTARNAIERVLRATTAGRFAAGRDRRVGG